MPEIAEKRRKGISTGGVLVVNSCTIERVVQLRSDTVTGGRELFVEGEVFFHVKPTNSTGMALGSFALLLAPFSLEPSLFEKNSILITRDNFSKQKAPIARLNY